MLLLHICWFEQKHREIDASLEMSLHRNILPRHPSLFGENFRILLKKEESEVITYSDIKHCD